MHALTAIATQATSDAVVECLSLEDPVTITLPPCRPNIKLIIRPATKLEELAFELSEKLKILKSKYPKPILLYHTYQDAISIIHVVTNVPLLQHCLVQKICIKY